MTMLFALRAPSPCIRNHDLQRSSCPTVFHKRQNRAIPACNAAVNGAKDERKKQKAHVAIVGSGPAAHTAAIYLARAELEPVIFEGWMAAGLPPGGQLTTTTYIENFPGFPEPILGSDLCDRFRKQSLHHGALIYTETVNSVELREGPPFRLETDMRVVEADAVILATGAAARKLRSIKGYDQFWNNGISACAVCDGANPFLRNQPVAVIGGGDVAMEEAIFMARYASKVYIVHRFNYLEASKIMARRAAIHPKIEILWESECVEAYGKDGLDGIKVRDSGTGEVRDLPVAGLFFGIGHAPATKFLRGQVELDEGGYIVTPPGRTSTSVPGVFAAGDVQDRKWRQAITAAGSGCKAAMETEWYLQTRRLDGAAGSTALTTGPQQLNAAWVAELKRQQGGLQQQGGVLVEDKVA